MRAAPVLLLLVGCGLGGGDSGGATNLPISGAGPYAKITDPNRTTDLEEPYVVIDPEADITDPAPAELADGTIRIFYTRAGSEIWRADLPGSLTEPAGPPTLVLAGATAPAVIVDGATVILFYQTADGVARATSVDGGASFAPDRLVVAGAQQPGATRAAGRFYLYYTRPDAPGIAVATSDDGLDFSEAAAPALMPRPGGFDAASVGEPGAVGAITAAGELHIGLFYAGASAKGVTAIGYAGSTDGLEFSALTAPVLDPGEPSEHGPAALVHPTRALLFFAQNRAGKSAIGLATSP
jgi:hypothetical protein